MSFGTDAASQFQFGGRLARRSRWRSRCHLRREKRFRAAKTVVADLNNLNTSKESLQSMGRADSAYAEFETRPVSSASSHRRCSLGE